MNSAILEEMMKKRTHFEFDSIAEALFKKHIIKTKIEVLNRIDIDDYKRITMDAYRVVHPFRIEYRLYETGECFDMNWNRISTLYDITRGFIH